MLETLKLFKLVHWPEPPPAIPATVRHLELMACPGLFSLDELQHLSQLAVLRLGLCPDLMYISVRWFAHLRDLSLVDVAVSKLDDLDCAPALREAYFAGLTELRRIGSTGRTQRSLRKLSVCRCPELADISGVASFAGLERLLLDQLHALTDLTPLSGLRYLTEVVIDDCPLLTSVAPLAALPALRRVTISRCPAVSDLHLITSRDSIRFQASM